MLVFFVFNLLKTNQILGYVQIQLDTRATGSSHTFCCYSRVNLL